MESLPGFQQAILAQQQCSSKASNIFWLTLLADHESCPDHSSTLLETVEQVAQLLKNSNNHNDHDQPTVYMGKINVSDMDKQLLSTKFGLTHTLTLVLVSTSPATYLVEYTGKLQTAYDLHRGVVCYFDLLLVL